MSGLLQLLLLESPVKIGMFGDNKSNPTLFYPGSGKDFSPLHCFLKHKSISTFVYCDYALAGIGGATAQNYRQIMQEKLPNCGVITAIKPVQLGAASWEDFWHESPDARKYAKPTECFGLHALFKHDGVEKHFIFLKTEALGTYRMLWGKHGKSPACVYLKDHGLGLNWTRYTGPAGLYKEACKNPPPFICAADHSDPGWPDYTATEDLPCGKLYRLNKPAK